MFSRFWSRPYRFALAALSAAIFATVATATHRAQAQTPAPCPTPCAAFTLQWQPQPPHIEMAPNGMIANPENTPPPAPAKPHPNGMIANPDNSAEPVQIVHPIASQSPTFLVDSAGSRHQVTLRKVAAGYVLLKDGRGWLAVRESGSYVTITEAGLTPAVVRFKLSQSP